MKSRLCGAVSACVFTFTSMMTAQAAPVSGQGTWETTLEGRDLDGNPSTFEAYYDTTLDITWLADANAAGTDMSWADADAWAAGLNVNGFTGWRLPTNTPVNGSTYNTDFSYDGTTDAGFATTTTDGTDGGWRDGSGNPVSEMGHMYYVTLGNLGFCDPTLPFPLCTEQTGWGLTNTGPFSNLQSDVYWSGSGFDSLFWSFRFETGGQDFQADEIITHLAWAVHSGEVPVPAAVWLFGSGLVGLTGIARRKKS